ncbi:MAG: LCP family protein [Clostridia bacterium]|nr:LCP family protein [Clostridia bacterium]
MPPAATSVPPAPKGQKPKRLRRRWLAGPLLLLLIGIIVAAMLAGILPLPWAPQPAGIRHYLFVGKDNWGELASAEQGRADAILLITLDFDSKSLSMTSFLRDTMVDMPGGGRNRLNTLSRLYGDEALRAYIEETYALDIAGMFSINFSGAVRVIDALGGITVDLTRAEANYLRRAVGNYGAEFTLREGPSRLNGAQALGYMRCRSLDSDFGRTNRQANVLKALMQEARAMPLDKVLRVVPEVLGFYATDLGLGDQLALARGLFLLRDAPLRRHQIPAEGAYRYTSVGGSSMLRIDAEKNRALFEAFLSGQ